MSGRHRIWPPWPDEKTIEYLKKLIVRCQGDLKKVAWEAGIHSRDKLYRKLYAYRLWPLVNAVRRERAEHLLRLRKRRR